MIAIIRPLPLAALSVSSNAASAENMTSFAPREVWLSGSASTHTIDIDLGAVTAVDTVFLGSTNLPSGAIWSVARGTGMGSGLTVEHSGTARLPNAIADRFQSLCTRPEGAPATRYLRITITLVAAAPIEIGVLGVGQAFRHPIAYPSMRQLIDTATVADLVDGGFGIGDGVSKASFKFKFVDLDNTTRNVLWSLVSRRGRRKPVIVVEDDQPAQPDDTSVHYGIFDRFEAWERANAVDTAWALGMTEWL